MPKRFTPALLAAICLSSAGGALAQGPATPAGTTPTGIDGAGTPGAGLGGAGTGGTGPAQPGEKPAERRDGPAAGARAPVVPTTTTGAAIGTSIGTAK